MVRKFKYIGIAGHTDKVKLALFTRDHHFLPLRDH